MASLHVGTSGFAFKQWKGPFYPEGLSDKKMLGYYSERLSTVEINYTFRRFPSETTMESWKLQTAENFRFTLKASQRITHFKRLAGVGEDVDAFVARARLLEDRLGTILFQLPPKFAYERVRLQEFLEGLPTGYRYAMEFRDPSWQTDEVSKMLQAREVALCVAETDELAVSDVTVTAPFVYLRLRKTAYGEGEIDVWAERARALLDRGLDVYCYFKHEDGGLGPRYASTLMEKVK